MSSLIVGAGTKPPCNPPVLDPNPEIGIFSNGGSQTPIIPFDQRPSARGKFIFIGDEKFFIRGVTYGPFRPNSDGGEYHSLTLVERDFASMAANGINTIRTYTVPDRDLLDAAQKYGLRVMMGLPWEQHIAFLDDESTVRSIETRVRDGVRKCAGHPALLCYTIGNEIPAAIVRWHGRRRVERFLKRLYQIAKSEDPDGLVTYVNFPTTEYLQLPFVDFVCFNVYLEAQNKLEAYLARLQNLAGDKPLVMAEIGLDSRRNGEDTQAHVLDWQIRTVFSAGCAGAFVFAWTDEWHRGGYDIDDWDFGLTSRDRQPKLALTSVCSAFGDVPFASDLPLPHISVVVCTHNGGATIRDCCEGLKNLSYRDFDVIVVNDGSTDATAEIVGEYGFQLINTDNQGLSSARNTGLAAATGEIVAYIDDDAYPDPHWLTYLASTFMSTEHMGVGGPNITPPGDGYIADCVACSPGNPTHILLSDVEAEHIPGCNMAFRRSALEEIGGFDTQFRIAGDDIDVCWRLQQCGWTLGYNPAAMVWHHRRNSVKAYWKQQLNYGKAEALLEKKWPQKYNTLGHLSWQGRLYGSKLKSVLQVRHSRVFHGVWGSGLFQSIYEIAPGTLSSLPLMPEWYLIIGGLALIALFGLLWTPLLLALPLLILSVIIVLGQAMLDASQASFPTEPPSRLVRLRNYALTTLLHLLQPLARLRGRFGYGLTPWRRRKAVDLTFPRPRISTLWREKWQAPEQWLERLEAALCAQGVAVKRGGEFDRWDLEICGGMFGSVRIVMAIEEHGGGKQLARFRSWPSSSSAMLVPAVLFVLGAVVAATAWGWVSAAVFGGVALVVVWHAFKNCASATATYLNSLRELGMKEVR